jgi:ubiquinol-cytochrome c reductase cytochrome c1 subunit
MFERKGIPSDRIQGPYPNDNAARSANNGSLPPDLSLMTKARVGGADYLYAVLTGYEAAPKDVHVAEGMHYNKAFPGHQIAMAKPLNDGAVTYSDGTKSTVAQMSHDVVTFLSWAAEPEMETRKKNGFKVLLFLSVFTTLMYFTMRRVWRDVK